MATPKAAVHRDLEQRLRDLERQQRDMARTLLRRQQLGVTAGDFVVQGGGSIVVQDGGGITVNGQPVGGNTAARQPVPMYLSNGYSTSSNSFGNAYVAQVRLYQPNLRVMVGMSGATGQARLKVDDRVIGGGLVSGGGFHTFEDTVPGYARGGLFNVVVEARRTASSGTMFLSLWTAETSP